jgi:hypothetical protein
MSDALANAPQAHGAGMAEMGRDDITIVLPERIRRSGNRARPSRTDHWGIPSADDRLIIEHWHGRKNSLFTAFNFELTAKSCHAFIDSIVTTNLGRASK